MFLKIIIDIKKACLVICILISVISFGQRKKEISSEAIKVLYDSIPKVDGKYEYTEIIVLDSTYKKEILYKNSKLFFANVFKSAKDVIQYDDREEGKVIVKGNFSVEGSQSSVLLPHFTEEWKVNFSLEIFSKDGKYRYRLYDLSILRIADSDVIFPISVDDAYKETQTGITKKLDKKLFVDMLYEIKSTISTLKSYMSKKTNTSNSDF